MRTEICSPISRKPRPVTVRLRCSAAGLSYFHPRGIVRGSGKFSLDSTIVYALTIEQSNA